MARARKTPSFQDYLPRPQQRGRGGHCVYRQYPVPFTKVVVMFTLLISIHFKCEQGLRTRILLLRFVTWIGRWSMLDLFVISLMMSLINRDQLLALQWDPQLFISALR